VLTFGKRSWGPFNGCADNGYPVPADDLTFGTFVDDVDRMLDHLGQRADIDRTVLIGHRKGSTIAATLAGTATWTPSCLSPPPSRRSTRCLPPRPGKSTARPWKASPHVLGFLDRRVTRRTRAARGRQRARARARRDIDDPAAITPADVGSTVDEQVIMTITDWLHTQVG
jgi:pimeloyl-ACP methyl ester carboxylesterase